MRAACCARGEWHELTIKSPYLVANGRHVPLSVWRVGAACSLPLWWDMVASAGCGNAPRAAFGGVGMNEDIVGDLARRSRELGQSKRFTPEQRKQKLLAYRAKYRLQKRQEREAKALQDEEQQQRGTPYPRGFDCAPGAFEPLYSAFREVGV